MFTIIYDTTKAFIVIQMRHVFSESAVSIFWYCECSQTARNKNKVKMNINVKIDHTIL